MLINSWWLLLALTIGFAAGWSWRTHRGPPRDDKGKFTGG